WGKRLEIKYYPNRINRMCSVAQDLRIEEGTLEDYKRLAEFHYRSSGHPPPLKVYALKRRNGETVGVILYSWPPANVFGRREALGRMLSLKEANQKVALISRVVLHPKYRSIGLGIRLVKETLPLARRRYVETIAVMARYNPFFEKAGMKKNRREEAGSVNSTGG
ncbi:TPA: GNAT family N-acetyltransferase, partial [Candidatus Bathyarchaeota archaeon]|nr:GNAT family N-acetyltransferase [Candidatus Bathyarchaeota archaeon]